MACTWTAPADRPFSVRMRDSSPWTCWEKGATFSGQKSWMSTLSRWQVSTISKKPRLWMSSLNRKRRVLSRSPLPRFRFSSASGSTHISEKAIFPSHSMGRMMWFRGI